ncbi:MAG: hypothetical protein J7465_18065, partial [Chloroflexus sp.]|nr:hypothetical protein [Chloroflexus sp.]
VVAAALAVPPDSSDVGSDIVATTDDDEDDALQTIPADALLAPDGTLRLEGTFNGTVDLSGWHVTLNPERGIKTATLQRSFASWRPDVARTRRLSRSRIRCWWLPAIS